ncbi:response regulator [Ruthenibacterium lactatiformans]|uniref:response regulator n=1 Tax=Ruthenibacterium lactatiformans TaxID=1550024 RepID=UPI00399FF3F8
MIVDDEDIIVSGLVKVMPWAKYGCEVAATASDGLAAQAVLREKRPDILFTDICMPGADGLALLAAVRSEFPDMQVTILSGFPDFEYAQRAIGLGVVRYVLKPSKMHELEEALAVMVENLGGAPASGAVQSAENAQNFIIKKAVQYIEQLCGKTDAADVADKSTSRWLSSHCQEHGTSFSDCSGVRIVAGAAGRPSPRLGSERRGLCGCDAVPAFSKWRIQRNEYPIQDRKMTSVKTRAACRAHGARFCAPYTSDARLAFQRAARRSRPNTGRHSRNQ